MFKLIGKVVLGSVIALCACGLVAKKTNLTSYASALWNNITTEAENQIPTKFELERIRNEIASLDGDISGMIRPIAETKAVIEKMTKDIDRDQKTLDEQKASLLAIVRQLDTNPKYVTVGLKQVDTSKVKIQLERDTEMLRKTELRINTQRKVLEAKHQSLAGTQEQLAKVVSKKREYEVRLSQLEADEETLKIAKIGTEVQFDNSRSTQIEEALAKVEHRQNVERTALEMRTTNTPSLLTKDSVQTGTPDLNAIRSYLESKEGSLADNK
jgi:peptidoglycan hydrolase CwlO-like protein